MSLRLVIYHPGAGSLRAAGCREALLADVRTALGEDGAAVDCVRGDADESGKDEAELSHRMIAQF